MKTNVPDPVDRDLQERLRRVADAFEASAVPEAQVVSDLEARLGRSGPMRVLATVALAIVVVAIAVVGFRAWTQPWLGGPAEMPALTGVYMTREPDADDRCFAIRLYDTTPSDGRAALWTWTAGASCAERTDSLATGVGRASGVRLRSETGIAIEAAEGAPPALQDRSFVVVPGEPPVVFPSLESAGAGVDGVPLEQVGELDVPYRPD